LAGEKMTPKLTAKQLYEMSELEFRGAIAPLVSPPPYKHSENTISCCKCKQRMWYGFDPARERDLPCSVPDPVTEPFCCVAERLRIEVVKITHPHSPVFLTWHNDSKQRIIAALQVLGRIDGVVKTL
jgi:hypothetical protein